MIPDFSQMYAELGLQPDCSLEQFQHAYRQRLSELHPDRAANRAARPAALPLNELIALHASAIAFLREHGRLPGSALPVAPPPTTPARPIPSPTDASDDERSTTTRWALAALLLAGSLLVGVFLEGSAPPSPPPEPAAVAEPQPAPETANGPLELGMDTETVRAIQGDPMRITDNTWEYGPSWLRFEHGELVDWYSSPLHRLKTRSPAPNAGADATEKYGR